MKESVSHALFIFLAWCAIALCYCSRMEAKMSNGQTALSEGGPCTYASYEGKVEIVRITQTPASVAQSKVIGGPGYEGHEVWFRFIAKSDIPHPEISPLIGREHLFTLHNGWYVGPRYLEKYRIQTGKAYPCVLKVIEEGTCTPVVFEFKTIDPKDYFESRPLTGK